MAFGFMCLHWDIAQVELLVVQSLKEVMQDWMFEAKSIIIEGDNFNIIKLLQCSLEKDNWHIEDFGL